MITRRSTKNLAIFAAALLFASPAFAAPQPKMEHALVALQHAMEKLQNAEHDKAGHRDRAIALVQQAIQQLQEGVAAGNR